MIDIHSHIHGKEFDQDRAEVISRARKAGMKAQINVGFDPEGNMAALKLAQQYSDIYATFGIHPHNASQYNDALFAEYEELINKDRNEAQEKSIPARIVAIGEMGLDFFKEYQPREVQKQAFQSQLKFAKEIKLPSIIHCRDAFEEALNILDELKIKRAIFHCFTGDLEIAEQIWKKGYATSFTGIVTFPSAKEIRKAVVKAPTKQFFLETDCPYLAPVPMRGKRNEPAFLRHTLEFIAELREENSDELEAHLDQSTIEYFQLG